MPLVGQYYTGDYNMCFFMLWPLPLAKLTMLPSVETQTVQFVHDARRCNDLVQARNLRFGGFHVYLKFKRDVNTGRETLIVSSVESPVRYRGRGWLWAYLRLCDSLVPSDVAIESVINKRLKNSLKNHPNFVELSNDYFVMTNVRP